MTDISLKLHKGFEKRTTEYLSKLIYAVLADIESIRDSIYDPLMWQSYKNILLPKEQRAKVAKRFTLTDGISQYIRMMFFYMINELTQIIGDINHEDTEPVICKKLIASIDDSYTAFIFQLVSEQSHRFTATLLEAGDTTNWFYNQFVEYIPAWSTDTNYIVVLARVSQQFYRFLKVIAWLLGNMICIGEVKRITDKMCLGILAAYSMPLTMVDKLASQIRVKAPRVAKKIYNAGAPEMPTITVDNVAPINAHAGVDESTAQADEDPFNLDDE